MGKSKITLQPDVANELSPLLNPELFDNLEIGIQKQVIENTKTLKEIEVGYIGKILGTKMLNVAIYSALIICVILLIFALIVIFASRYICKDFILDLIKTLVPIITMSLGYMFGKNN